MVDAVQQPPHYTSHPSGVEMTAIAEHFGFCLGNVIKYVWRANLKGEPLEDLRKAAWYLDREIARREAADAAAVAYECSLGYWPTLPRDRLEPFNTPGHAPADDEQIIRGSE